MLLAGVQYLSRCQMPHLNKVLVTDVGIKMEAVDMVPIFQICMQTGQRNMTKDTDDIRTSPY